MGRDVISARAEGGRLFAGSQPWTCWEACGSLFSVGVLGQAGRSAAKAPSPCLRLHSLSNCGNQAALAARSSPPTSLEWESEALRCLTTTATDVGDNDAMQPFSNCSFSE